MRSVVVEDEVKLEVGRSLVIDGLQECEKLLRAMIAKTLADHAAGGNVEGGEQGSCSMSLISARFPLRRALCQGEKWLRSVECLNL